MGVPDHLLIHQVTIVRPATATDAYNNTTYDYGPAAARTTVAGWVQQDQRQLQTPDGRSIDTERWLLVTNHPDVDAEDRVEWTGPDGPMVFETAGPPAPVYAGLAQTFHHTEASLRIIEG